MITSPGREGENEGGGHHLLWRLGAEVALLRRAGGPCLDRGAHVEGCTHRPGSGEEDEKLQQGPRDSRAGSEGSWLLPHTGLRVPRPHRINQELDAAARDCRAKSTEMGDSLPSRFVLRP